MCGVWGGTTVVALIRAFVHRGVGHVRGRGTIDNVLSVRRQAKRSARREGHEESNGMVVRSTSLCVVDPMGVRTPSSKQCSLWD